MKCVTHLCDALTLTVTGLLQIYRRPKTIETISELLCQALEWARLGIAIPRKKNNEVINWTWEFHNNCKNRISAFYISGFMAERILSCRSIPLTPPLRSSGFWPCLTASSVSLVLKTFEQAWPPPEAQNTLQQAPRNHNWPLYKVALKHNHIWPASGSVQEHKVLLLPYFVRWQTCLLHLPPIRNPQHWEEVDLWHCTTGKPESVLC